MAAKTKAKRKHHGRRNGAGVPHRNAGTGGGRPRAVAPRSKQSKAMSNVAVAVGGGALGALAAGVAVGAGIRPQTAAVATLAGGALGAYALKGNAKVAAIGAACAASGQLALAWQVKRQAEQEARKKADSEAKQVATAAPPAQLPAPAVASAAPKNGAAAPKRNAAAWDDDEREGVVDDLRNAGDDDDDGDGYDDED